VIREKLLKNTNYFQTYKVPFTYAVKSIVLANILFFLLMYVGQGNKNVIEKRIEHAFAMEDLVLTDYLSFDTRRGYHQYNDCVVLQMIVNESPSRIEHAIAPSVYINNDHTWRNQCAMLYNLVVGDANRDNLIKSNYARYWHGYNALVASALSFMELRVLRLFFTTAIWCSIVLLVVISFRKRPNTRRTGLAIATSSAIFWSIPFFAPNFTHGPGDILVLLGVTGIGAWGDKIVRNKMIIPYAACYGSVITFFEMLTGQLPIAAAWLGAMTLAIYRDAEHPYEVRVPALVLVTMITFALGSAITVGTKQILALLLVDVNIGKLFLLNLVNYNKFPESGKGWPGFLLPFRELALHTGMLAFGNRIGGYGIIITFGIFWFTSAVLGWKLRQFQYGRDMLILGSIALIPIAWILLLPTHTYLHAGFMVRILIIPISIAPLALFWPRNRDGVPEKHVESITFP
jgi:hypothetical protein